MNSFFKILNLIRLFLFLCLCGRITLKELLSRISKNLYIYKKINSIRTDISEEKLAKNIQVTHSDLTKAFTFKLMNRHEREVTKLICTAINVRNADDEYQSRIEEIRAVLKNSEDKLTVMWLTDIESIAIVGGLFVLAYDIRQICVNKLKNKYKRKRRVHYFDVQRLYASHLYSGEPIMAAEVLERAGNLWKRNNEANYLQMAVMARGGSLAEFSSITNVKTKQDEKYRELLKGKSIAILGPAAGSQNVDELVNDFDIKICTNYRGMELQSDDAKRYGIDVSYYNAYVPGALFEEDKLHIFKELKMAVLYSVRHDFEAELIKTGVARERLGTPDIFMFQGMGNTVQNILMDLFHFENARIKLFNVNLYLANINAPNREGYSSVARKELNKEYMWWNYALHNIISHYEITKYWYEAGYFEADEELAYVLSLGTREYLRLMELM